MNEYGGLVQLMVATTLVLLCTRPPLAALAKFGPWLLPLPAIAIIGREVLLVVTFHYHVIPFQIE